VTPAETLAVHIAGAGRPVVLIPGLFGSAYAYRNVVPDLTAAGRQAITIEILGTGASARPARADYSLAAQAGRVAAVLDTLQVRGAIVVAHSLGGAVALRLAVERPDLVAGLVSIEGGPAETATSAGFRRAMAWAPLLKLFGGKGIVRGKVVKQLHESSADTTWITPEVIEGYTAGAMADFGATLDAFMGMARAREPWALGPRLGSRLPAVKAALGAADGAEVRRALEADGHYDVDVGGERVELGPDDLEVRAEEHEEFALAQDGPYAVALDLALDEDLRLEGHARELARALNDHRKAIGLAIADRIRVTVSASGALGEAARRHGKWIAGEVLAVGWEVAADGLPGAATLEVDGEPVAVAVERVPVA